MSTTELTHFQESINQLILRNKSILDQSTKLQEGCCGLNRKLYKSATTCGCIQIVAVKQNYPLNEDLSIDDLNMLLDTHVQGELCPKCKDLIEKEMGKILFYLTCMANTLGLSLSDVLSKELYTSTLLGKYTLK